MLICFYSNSILTTICHTLYRPNLACRFSTYLNIPNTIRIPLFDNQSVVSRVSGNVVSSVVNYDSATAFYNLVIRASDSVNNVDVPVAVTLSPVNEATPTFSQSPKTVSFAEDTAVGTVLDTFVAADSDYAPHAIVTYAITTGVSSTRSISSIRYSIRICF